MSVSYEQKASSALQQLGRDVAEQQLDQAAQQAAAAGWSYTHFLGYLLDAEMRFRRVHPIGDSSQGGAKDFLFPGKSVDQQWSVDGKRVQLVVGRDTSTGAQWAGLCHRIGV